MCREVCGHVTGAGAVRPRAEPWVLKNTGGTGAMPLVLKNTGFWLDRPSVTLSLRVAPLARRVRSRALCECTLHLPLALRVAMTPAMRGARRAAVAARRPVPYCAWPV